MGLKIQDLENSIKQYLSQCKFKDKVSQPAQIVKLKQFCKDALKQPCAEGTQPSSRELTCQELLYLDLDILWVDQFGLKQDECLTKILNQLKAKEYLRLFGMEFEVNPVT